MGNLLDKVSFPEDFRGFSSEELKELAGEVREFMIEAVSKTGGHLASSLGAVEIAIAIHYAFNTPHDKVVWDVGHQAYAHKILTGRRKDFSTLRQFKGISGFPKPSESPFDSVTAGHSSTSISSGLGMAFARDLSGGDSKIVSVIGDGSMTAGIAFEGLNQAGHIKKGLVVVLNDNDMSISENVGALANFLSRKLTGPLATKVKGEVQRFVEAIPKIGGGLVNIVKKAEDSLITLFTPGMLFEGLGFHYVGPVDGHNIDDLVKIFKNVGAMDVPVLVHVITKKGKGYAPAEREPSKFHGIGPFDIATGSTAKSTTLTYTKVFSSTLIEMAEADGKVVAITAAMPEGTGLGEFKERFPERFIDVGIAEQHAITFAAGMAREGFKPITAIYSTFLQRAYDQVFHDVCLDNVPLIMALDRAGLVGADGPTHHGLYDIAYLRHLPNMIVAAPKDGAELRSMMHSAVKYNAPVSIRYPRGATPEGTITDVRSAAIEDIELGRSEFLRKGKDLTILALGTMVGAALEAAESLKAKGIDAAVINARFVKPLDSEAILRAAKATGTIITIEEAALQGGFGSAVLELLEAEDVDCLVRRIGVPDSFIEQGTQKELYKDLGLDAEGIEKAIVEFMEKRKT